MSDDIELTEEESAAFWEAINPRPIPPPERAILTDLISELREGHPTFGDEPPLWVKTALYAAENRLRKSIDPR